METVLLDIVPLGIAAALAPVWVIVVLVLLRGDNGLHKVIALVSGGIVVRLLQGVVFGPILGSVTKSAGENDEAGAVASTLLLVLGVLMWITAVRKFRKGDDPDAPPPQWMTLLGSAGPLKTFGLGALLMLVATKQWVFTLGALSLIRDGDIERAEGVIVFLAFVVGASLLQLAPIGVRLVAPTRSATLLQAAGDWLERNERPILVAASAVFGTFFLVRGVTGLLG